jgi:very-short-patch-repair endonuclease
LTALGIGRRTIDRWVQAGRLGQIRRGVYVVGSGPITQRSRWMAGVLACGKGAVLSHRSAAALWGLMRPGRGPVEVTSSHGRSRGSLVVHRAAVEVGERTQIQRIPVTTIARTLLDLAEVVDEQRLRSAFEEADRLRLLEIGAVARLCARRRGRRGLRHLRPLIAAAIEPAATASALEDLFAAFCRDHRLPPPITNVLVLGLEVDTLWPRQRLIVEMDGFAFHRHRAAFERDRARDAELMAAGYRVVRLTHRRIHAEPEAVAAQLRRLLAAQGRGG